MALLLRVRTTHPHKVAQGDRKANGQGWGAHRAGAARVSGGEDAECQLEGQDELHHHRLACCDVAVELQGKAGLGPWLFLLCGWGLQA